MATTGRIDELRKRYEENQRRFFAPLANEYRKAGDLEQAIDLCRMHLAEAPANLSGQIVFGQALFEAGNLDDARGAFETAVGLDPENLIGLRHLGDIGRLQGDLPRARLWYQRVLDADRRNDEVLALMAELEAELAAGDSSPADAPAVPVAQPVEERAAPSFAPPLIEMREPEPPPEPTVSEPELEVAPTLEPASPTRPPTPAFTTSVPPTPAFTRVLRPTPVVPAGLISTDAPTIEIDVIPPPAEGEVTLISPPASEPRVEALLDLEPTAFAPEPEITESVAAAESRLVDFESTFDMDAPQAESSAGAAVDDRSAGSLLEPVVEPTVEPIESLLDPVDESIPGATVEAVSEATSEPIAELLPEPLSEPAVEGTAPVAADTSLGFDVDLGGAENLPVSAPRASSHEFGELDFAIDVPVVPSHNEAIGSTPDAVLEPTSDALAEHELVTEFAAEFEPESVGSDDADHPLADEDVTISELDDVRVTSMSEFAVDTDATSTHDLESAPAFEIDHAVEMAEAPSAAFEPPSDASAPVVEMLPAEFDLPPVESISVAALNPALAPTPVVPMTPIIPMTPVNPVTPVIPLTPVNAHFVIPPTPVIPMAAVSDMTPVIPTTAVSDMTPVRELTPIVPTPITPFATETMAELYVRQGLRQEAITVYRQLVAARPHDAALTQRLAELELPGIGAAGATARSFFASLATRRATPLSVAAIPVAPAPASGSVEQLFGRASVGAHDEGVARALAQAYDENASAGGLGLFPSADRGTDGASSQ